MTEDSAGWERWAGEMVHNILSPAARPGPPFLHTYDPRQPDAAEAVAWLRGQIEADRAQAESAPAPYLEVIADCDSKLAILDEHPAEHHGQPPYWDGVVRCETCLDDRHLGPEFWDGNPWPCKTIRLLASAYQHRDGFAEHWGTPPTHTLTQG